MKRAQRLETPRVEGRRTDGPHSKTFGQVLDAMLWLGSRRRDFTVHELHEGVFPTFCLRQVYRRLAEMEASGVIECIQVGSGGRLPCRPGKWKHGLWRSRIFAEMRNGRSAA